MKCIPRYTVSYRGIWHEAGRAFEIDAEDADELKKHGEIVGEPAPEPAKETKTSVGRARKNKTE